MTQAEALAAFSELSTPLEKLEKLIREDCACYERGEDWFRVVIRERDLIPELDEMARSAEETLATLVGAALEGTPAPAELHSALRALIDFPFWMALVSAGVDRSHAPSMMRELAASLLARHGVSFRDG